MACDPTIRPDYDALKYSSQALLGIFFVLVAVLNVFLIVTLLVKGRAVHSPRRFIILSMAFGSLFYAVFFLLINLLYYQEQMQFNCEIRALVNTYFHLYRFVNSLSLIVLCCELLGRRRIRSMSGKPLLVGIILGGIPWIIGLAVMLPTFMVDFNFETCSYKSGDTQRRLAILFYVSTIGPVVLTLIVCIVTRLISASSTSEFYDDNGANYLQHGAEMVVLPLPYHESNPGANGHPQTPVPITAGSKPAEGYPGHTNPQGNPHPSHVRPQPMPQTAAQYPPMPCGEPGQVAHQNPGLAPPLAVTNSSGMIHSPVVVGNTPGIMLSPQTARVPQESKKEENVLLVMSCLLCFLLLGHAIFYVGHVLKDYSDRRESLCIVEETVILNVLWFVGQLWGVISPIVWMVVLLRGHTASSGIM